MAWGNGEDGSESDVRGPEYRYICRDCNLVTTISLSSVMKLIERDPKHPEPTCYCGGTMAFLEMLNAETQVQPFGVSFSRQ